VDTAIEQPEAMDEQGVRQRIFSAVGTSGADTLPSAVVAIARR